jgi:hypothetical protein
LRCCQNRTITKYLFLPSPPEKLRKNQYRIHRNTGGKIELDESYFGGHRKGKRGRGAAGKVAVFGILKRGGKVYTQIILDAKTSTLMPIICHRIEPDSNSLEGSGGAFGGDFAYDWSVYSVSEKPRLWPRKMPKTRRGKS